MALSTVIGAEALKAEAESNINRQKERGAALIIVLGLVALISSWVITTLFDDSLALRRAENMQDLQRAEQASQSSFALSVKVLREDDDYLNDDLDEDWAQQAPGFPIDEGIVSGRIVDANRFFNLNALIDQNGAPQQLLVTAAKKLFQQLELEAALVDAVIDWIDANSLPSGAGAESSAYYDKDYRVKNAPIERWDELKLIRGFDEEKVARLSRVAVAIPIPVSLASSWKINLNSAEPMVLMALFPTMTEPDAEAFIAERPLQGTVAQILANRHWAAGVNQTFLSLSSDTFMVRTAASFGRVELHEEYVVERKQNKEIKLLSRERMSWDRILTEDMETAYEF